jgi:putative copper export protein
VLLLKLAVLSPVAATGAYNWLRVRPALGGDAGAARIRRSATAELAVGALVLLATAALVATPTAMEGSADDEAAAGGAPVAADR